MMKKTIILISMGAFVVFISFFLFVPSVFAYYYCGDCPCYYPDTYYCPDECGVPADQCCPDTCEDATYCYWDDAGDYCTDGECVYEYREEKTSCDNYCAEVDGVWYWYHDANPQCTTSGWDCNYQVTNCGGPDGYDCTGANRCGGSEGEERVYRDYSCDATTGCEFSETPIETCRCDAEETTTGCIDYEGCTAGQCTAVPNTDRCSYADEACFEYNDLQCVSDPCCRLIAAGDCVPNSCSQFTTSSSCETCGGCKWVDGTCRSAEIKDYYKSASTCDFGLTPCTDGPWECDGDCSRRREIFYCSDATCVSPGVYESEDCPGPFKCESNGNCPGTTCWDSCNADPECHDRSPGSSWCTQTATSCTEHTCNGSCQHTFDTDSDGWRCEGETRVYKDHYCDAGTGTCKYTLESPYDCNQDNGCSNGYELDYTCFGGNCVVDTSTCTEYCCELRYGGDSDAYCSGGPGGGECLPPAPPITTIYCNDISCIAGWYNADVKITFTCSDPGSGCANSYYCVDQTDTCSPTTTYTGSFYVTTEVTNYIRFYSIDNGGNAEGTNSQPVNLDKTPPSDVSVTGAPGNWQSTDACAAISCTDALSGCDTTTYKFKIIPYTDTPPDCSTYSYDTEYSFPSPDGCSPNEQVISSYSWVCGAAKDLAGNTGFSSPEEFMVEKDPPDVSVTGAPASWQNTDATADVSCTDGLSDCDTDSYRLKIDSTDPGVCSTNYAEYTSVPQTISSHSWVCGAAKDNAGNEGYSSPEEFKVDKTKPTSLITFPLPDPETGDHPWYNEDFSVQVDDEDEGGSGLADCYYHVCNNWNEPGFECIGSWTKNKAARNCDSYFTVTVGDTGEDCDREKVCAVFVLSKDIAGTESEWDHQWYNIGIFIPNNPPKATNLDADPDNPALCCGVTGYPPVRFSWQFSDLNIGDAQSAYQIQTDDNSDFSSPIDITEGIVLEPSDEFIPQPPFPTLSFDTTYWWRIRVWDESSAISDCGNPDGWCYPPNPIVVDDWSQSSQADFEAGVLIQMDTSTSPGDVKIEQRNCWGTGGSYDTNCIWSSTTYQSYYYSGGCQATTYCRSDSSYRGTGTPCSNDGTGDCYKLTGSRTRYTGCSKGSGCASKCKDNPGCYCPDISSDQCSACGCSPGYDPAGPCENNPGCSCDPGLSPGQCSACECTYDDAGPCGESCSCGTKPKSFCEECEYCSWNDVMAECTGLCSCAAISGTYCSICGCSWDPANCYGSCSCGNITSSLDCGTCPGCEWDPVGPCEGGCSCANIGLSGDCTACPGCEWGAYEWTPSLSGSTTVYSSRTPCSFYKYFSSGTIASQVNDTGSASTVWDQLSWSETLQDNTNITFEVRTSDTIFTKDAVAPAWTDLELADSPITSGLPSGRYQQWRATLTTTDYANTPILESVIITYSTGTPTPPPGDSFATILHPFPYVKFDWIPKSPVVDEVVQFCSVYEEVEVPCDEPPCPVQVICSEKVGKRSICYQGIGNINPIPCDELGLGSEILWEIIPETGGVFVEGTDKYSSNPRISFLSSTVKLKIIDEDSYICSETEDVPISLPLPKWKEIKPF